MNTETGSAAMPQFKPDFVKIFTEVKEVTLNPVGCWSSVRGTYGSTKDFYMNFLGPLILIQPVVGMIMGLGSLGITTAITLAIVQFGLGLVMTYLVSFILAKLAKSFGGSDDILGALKLSGYSRSPVMLAAVLGFIPVIGGLVGFLLAIYSIYIFYQGISPMLAVPANQRLIFTIVAAILIVVASAVVGLAGMLVFGGAMVGAGATLG
jgi:hypothetical protein